MWLLVEKGKPLLHRRVHRLVATAFIENPNNLPEIHHKNHIKDDNYASNLEWCTTRDNVQEAKGHRVTVLKNGKEVATFPSVKDAAKFVGVSDTMVLLCLRGQYDGTHGYQFDYAK